VHLKRYSIHLIEASKGDHSHWILHRSFDGILYILSSALPAASQRRAFIHSLCPVPIPFTIAWDNYVARALTRWPETIWWHGRLTTKPTDSELRVQFRVELG